jgi:hypothetical protein
VNPGGIAAAGLACACALTACSDDPSFDHLHFRNVSSAPGTASLRPTALRLETGIAVKARVSAIGDDGEPLGQLELQSSDTSIFVVDLGPRLGEYVFYGVEEGSAELDVYAERIFQDSLPVTVIGSQ